MFPWKPIRLRLNADRQVDEAFERLIDVQWGRISASQWQPQIDVYEAEDAILIQADLPGLDPEDLEIAIDGEQLTLSGQRHSTDMGHSAQEVWIERRTGHFSRTIRLPCPIDAGRIELQQDHGIILIRLPKPAADTMGDT